MNIAIFSPNKNPYSETFIQAHKNHLAGEVFYYYGNQWDSIALEWTGQKFNTLSLFQKIQLKASNGSVTGFQKRNLASSLRANKVDVALIEYGHHAHWLLAVLKLAAIPFVVHFHGHDATEHQILKNTSNYAQVFKAASKVIAVSTVMRDKLAALGCPSDKLVYNVYGPRPEFAEINPTFGSLKLLSVGRFTNKKAPYYTLMAFAKVAKDFPQAELVFAGDGVLFETCKNLCSQMDLTGQVRFMGVATVDQVQAELQTALAYVQHSITALNGDMEGTPLSILEASSAGLPVISTIHAGIPDVIIHEKTGLLCPEHDVSTMAANMRKLLSDPQLAKSMGAAAKKHIATHFTLARHIGVLDELLEEVAKS